MLVYSRAEQARARASRCVRKACAAARTAAPHRPIMGSHQCCWPSHNEMPKLRWAYVWAAGACTGAPHARSQPAPAGCRARAPCAQRPSCSCCRTPAHPTQVLPSCVRRCCLPPNLAASSKPRVSGARWSRCGCLCTRAAGARSATGLRGACGGAPGATCIARALTRTQQRRRMPQGILWSRPPKASAAAPHPRAPPAPRPATAGAGRAGPVAAACRRRRPSPQQQPPLMRWRR